MKDLNKIKWQAGLGIGFDEKVMLLVFNIEGITIVKVQCYSRHTRDPS
jgi:hypothetical protein